MSTSAKRPPATVTINLRVDKDTLDLIERGRAAAGLNRTDFLLTSAKAHACDVLLDRTFLTVSPDEWARFSAHLDNPPPYNAKLVELLDRVPPWKK